MLIRRRKLNLYDLKLLKEFLTSKDERRELQALQEIPAANKLQQLASKFVLGVRCQEGFYCHLHLLKVYIFTDHFEIQKLIFVGYHRMYLFGVQQDQGQTAYRTSA